MWKGKAVRLIVALLGTLLISGVWLFAASDQASIGAKLDEYRGVAVYSNGLIYSKSHGKHYSDSGYYYGQKWQCVEFVKRFFQQAHHHEMPDVWGHATDFFDESVPQGELNAARGLFQFQNGGDIYPKAGDLVVFTNGSFGHVAIICGVTTNEVEIIQQNVLGYPRQKLPLKWTPKSFIVGDTYQPAGWLRVPKKEP
jgi:surface antigen